jgi:hypothetical protein
MVVLIDVGGDTGKVEVNFGDRSGRGGAGVADWAEVA